MQRMSLVLTAIVLASSLSAIQAQPPGQPVEISGVYFGGTTGRPFPPPRFDTSGAPLLPEAKALYEARMASDRTDRPWSDTEVACLPAGMPRFSLALAPYPFEILQTPGQITMISEAPSVVRRIYLNRDEHPENLLPTWMGDSIGRWEEDTLVVETVGINGRSTVDKRGLPMSNQMRVVERIRQVDENTIENEITMEDPEVFSRPWTVTMHYTRARPGTEIAEYVCEGLRIVRDEDGYILGMDGALE